MRRVTLMRFFRFFCLLTFLYAPPLAHKSSYVGGFASASAVVAAAAAVDTIRAQRRPSSAAAAVDAIDAILHFHPSEMNKDRRKIH